MFDRIRAAVPAPTFGRRTGHLVYFGGVFVAGHGLYAYAAGALLVIEGILWLAGQGE